MNRTGRTGVSLYPTRRLAYSLSMFDSVSLAGRVSTILGALLIGFTTTSTWGTSALSQRFLPEAHRTAPSSPSSLPRAIADTTVPDYDIQTIEHQIHEEINAERTKRERSPLVYADSLHHLGMIHSHDMADRGFFGHNNPDGQGVNERAATLGLSCVRQIDERTTARGFGENLYRGTLFSRYQDVFQDGQPVRREFDWKTESAIASDVVQGWMNSPGHRANILEDRYAIEAIAVHVAGTHFFVTQIFC